jgi:hypothetical protein
MYMGRRGWGREEPAKGEKKGISVYRAPPKVPELLTTSLTTSWLGISCKEEDQRVSVWDEGSGPGLDIWLLSRLVLQVSERCSRVPSKTSQFSLLSQKCNFRRPRVGRGEKHRRRRPRGVRGFQGRKERRSHQVETACVPLPQCPEPAGPRAAFGARLGVPGADAGLA